VSEFKPVTIGRARWLAEQFGAERVVIISTSGDRYSITSYGASVAVCKRLAKRIKEGELDQVAVEIAEA
jgi:hypothetical protein